MAARAFGFLSMMNLPLAWAGLPEIATQGVKEWSECDPAVQELHYIGNNSLVDV